MKIAITGGIGSGKSHVCRLLQQRGIEVYDCDSAAKRLMNTSKELKEQLSALIGSETYTADGLLNKAAVTQFLLQSEANIHAINKIVHPAVIEDFLHSGLSWMESAILHQADLAHIADYVIAVTAPEDIRIQRIIQRDGIPPEKAQEWIDRQWPQSEIRRLADHEIINDGRPLEPQLEALLNKLNNNDIQQIK
ncbi:MAG: dephospho-CoA kinase [Prevotella sp.]|nr:dephospho-CoA kinase [Prevotella sp.]